ncbi:LAMI_0D08724g1_1 [Lachancea mirantina]|uniref:Mitochondrial pyruvate carrier n=1 Tax=Lachancea mirantina TaxID=1230905 RepID=A0A1G4JD67_9SACH|nr:LAMI_0D08724g1_1 [Lachancea mirantina]
MSQPAQRAATQSFINKFINKQTLKYVFTTHFWGPVSNFGIPLAAIYDLKKDPELISGPMTGALIAYSAVFMRYALAVTPKNYLLFGCHIINEGAQIGQAVRFLNYHYLSPGRETKKESSA